MAAYRTILVTINGCCAGRRAIEHAADLARDHHARLFVLSLVPPPLPLNGVGVASAAPDPQPGFARELQRALDALPPDVGVEGQLASGPAARQILGMASSRSCDLIVLGCDGHPRIRRLFRHPVCETVLRHSRCPVLLVGPASVGALDPV